MALSAVPQTQAPQVPTKEQLILQSSNLVCQRSQLKDKIEEIERQLPVIGGMIQLLSAQEALAIEEINKD